MEERDIKTCYKCNKVKEFTTSGNLCKDCKTEYDKNYRNKNKYKIEKQKEIDHYSGKSYIWARKSSLKKKYNITIDEYNKLLIEQNDSCAICKSKDAGGRGNFHVDHCHETNKVRGLLCHYCNIGLGVFKDNIETLNNAIKYLQ